MPFQQTNIFLQQKIIKVINMKEILFKLNEFCGANRIEYMVTGTVALSLLGVPSNFSPQDIDIKIFHLTEEQKDKLIELQFLSGLNNENYKDQCYSFYINDVKVNVIIDNTQSYNEISNMGVCLSLQDEKQAKYHAISVQKVAFAIRDKMSLGRLKDYEYMQNLIHNLTLK